MYAGERFNSITHIIGSVLAIIGSAFAIRAVAGRDATTIAAITIYGAMLIVLYLSSTLYHSWRGPAKQIFHVFDHCAIYLLIAGTYTPITLITLRGPWGWWLFGIVWTLAIAGVLKDVLLRGRYRPISVVLYVLMGWLVVVAIKPLRLAMPPNGIAWIAAGGAIYTAGIVFFALSKRVAHMHGIWHLCVIGGSACHYVAVMRYVAT
ncbi:MAG: hemolysin [Thermoanaerobaculia bacterium]|jgi:hemolysin III|nr:hemolysin [Thermoanaerobaculia bacterium]MEA2414186.1 hemolysin [Thermoanaerobaculia bacterium]